MKIVAHLHSIYSLNGDTMRLMQSVDKVVVHTAESRLEAIANGANPDKVEVLPHGVSRHPMAIGRKRQLRTQLGLPVSSPIVTTFGFLQPHKGIHETIQAIAAINSQGYEVYGLILGSPLKGDNLSIPYIDKLQEIIKANGMSNRIKLITHFLSDSELIDYLQLSEVVVLNYLTRYYEASGAASLAIGADCLLACSTAPAFIPFKDAVWHISEGIPLDQSILALLSNPELRLEIQKNAAIYADENSWEKVASKLKTILYQVVSKPQPLEQAVKIFQQA